MADDSMTIRLLDILSGTGDTNRDLVRSIAEKSASVETRLDSEHAEQLEENLADRYQSYEARGAKPEQVAAMQKRYEQRIEFFGAKHRKR